MDDLCFTPATELSRQIARKALSPVELTDAVLARIERLNPKLNSFLTVTADRARTDARAAEQRAQRGDRIGPLDGIPFSLKDLESTAGIRTTFGSKFFENNVPTMDGVNATRLKAAGGVLLGKTNTSHFGYKDMCDNLLGDACRNPWKLDRTSGASSGGAGAAVAAGLGPIAHGTDGAGSVRIPAALCGIFGLKPSYGRVPIYPNADLFATRSHSGPMTRTVRDAAMMLQVMAGPDRRDPHSIDAAPEDYTAACDGDLKGLRIAWSPDLGLGLVEPEVREAAEAAARRFVSYGATLDSPRIAWPDPRAFHAIIYQTGIAARVGDKAAERPDWIEATMMRMIVEAGRHTAIQHAQALMARTAYYDAVRTFFDDYDLLLTPQMPVEAWSCTPGANEGVREIAGQPVNSMMDRLTFTYPFNLTGQPAATVPCGFTKNGLPIGLQIVGRWHADATVLKASACFEADRPWATKRPPL